ncbi:SAM-dependent methyltransferase [Actinomadura barringtoniae]|uniref:SAM-dependent methyltransferase n=1 Tax=Actinomadura barringtoniae TaxID=1427535 RepID=A0A939PK45_9ACTN|nr:SAM-dependent methyltransferase [Actinomadura barringtoniae]MBO2454392.1 SAM-dependent methyltransferase [Actinomadura barringtoniae]
MSRIKTTVGPADLEGGCMAENLPPGLDLSVPSAARMYDYFLGGKDNFEVDRERAEQVIKGFPEVRDVARANRAFLGAAVRTVAEAGVAQFVDLGAGLPTQGHVHEVARPIRPDTRVVYVDIDPVACVHARALLPDEATAVVNADIRRPQAVLDDPAVGRLIDWERPVALLLVSVLQFIVDEDDEPGRMLGVSSMLGAFTRRMVPGSHLVLSVASGAEDFDVDSLADAYKGSGTGSGGLRSAQQIEKFFTGSGFELLEPGLVDVHDWPVPAPGPRAAGPIRLLGGVGRKP